VNDANGEQRLSVAKCIFVVFAAGLLVGAGPAKPQGAAPWPPQTEPAPPAAPWDADPAQKMPPQPPKTKSFQPPKKRYRLVTRDGKTVLVPQDESQDFNPPPPPRPYGPHGRARAIKELLEGDPTAWTIFAGIVGAFVLAFVVSLAFRGPRRAAPEEIAASWQKQRVLCMASAFAGIPAGLILGGIAGVACGSALVFALVFCPVLFVTLVVNIAKWRCPACGRGMGNNWNPRFCPKCGAGLQETERPTTPHGDAP